MDADNVERDLQGAGAQGGDELGEGEDVFDRQNRQIKTLN